MTHWSEIGQKDGDPLIYGGGRQRRQIGNVGSQSSIVYRLTTQKEELC